MNNMLVLWWPAIVKSSPDSSDTSSCTENTRLGNRHRLAYPGALMSKEVAMCGRGTDSAEHVIRRDMAVIREN